MEQLKIAVLGAGFLLFAYMGYLGIFRAQTTVERALQAHEERKQSSDEGTPRLVTDPRYPTYLRLMGIGSWLLALGAAFGVYLEVTARSRLR